MPGLGGFPLAGIGAGTGWTDTAGSTGGTFTTAGTFGTAGIATAGADGVAGMDASAGIGGEAGSGALAGMDATAGTGAAGAGGTPGGCCSDGDCLCRDDAPSALTSSKGKYKFATFSATKGTVYYPTDAAPPFAAVAVCGGFTNTGPEMNPWGEFYASHGIVTIITSTLGTDDPATRAAKLLAAIAELKSENDKSGGMLLRKLAGRYGTSGYSMGGGGTTIASGDDSTLKTSVGLAPWGPDGSDVQVPTLLLCGGSDTTAPCSMTDGAYTAIPAATPKMKLSINGTSHLAWFGPTQAGMGTSGAYALAFQKVFLEGDERWKPLLLGKPSNGTATTNIQ